MCKKKNFIFLSAMTILSAIARMRNVNYRMRKLPWETWNKAFCVAFQAFHKPLKYIHIYISHIEKMQADDLNY